MYFFVSILAGKTNRRVKLMEVSSARLSKSTAVKETHKDEGLSRESEERSSYHTFASFLQTDVCHLSWIAYRRQRRRPQTEASSSQAWEFILLHLFYSSRHLQSLSAKRKHLLAFTCDGCRANAAGQQQFNSWWGNLCHSLVAFANANMAFLSLVNYEWPLSQKPQKITK